MKDSSLIQNFSRQIPPETNAVIAYTEVFVLEWYELA